MSIQYIIDRAQQIEIDRRRMVGQTISRSQRVKTAERSTAQPYKFTVTPPPQIPWEQARPVIEVIDLADRAGEYEISLNNSAGMQYITRYQGELTASQRAALTIDSVSTTTAAITVGNLPAVSSSSTTFTTSTTAQSLPTSVDPEHDRAFSSTRADFLITTAEYTAKQANILTGSVISASVYVTSGQTVTSITPNWATYGGVSYTRIVMSAPANVSSPRLPVAVPAIFTKTVTTAVSATTVLFRRGDLIQPANSRYPYSVTEDVLRGSNSTVTVPLHRAIITSENITVTGQNLKIGNQVTWRVIVMGLPTYTLINRQRVQYNGDFELIEKVI